MTDAPRLTDRSALLRNRARAARAPVDFLDRIVADEIEERLAEVKRRFIDPAIVTGRPDFWAGCVDGATLVPDDPVLALEPAAHDLVLHVQSLHWADDPVGQLVQAARALRPDGLLIATAFGGRTLQELRASLAEAEAKVTGGLSPRVAPMAEIRDMGGLLQRAGLALPVADGSSLTVSYASPFHLMRELRQMGEGNALADRLRRFTRKSVLFEAARIYAESYGDTDGRIPATFEILTLTGWAPSPDQPQPLRPGSAAARLADALGTDETKLPRD